MKVFADNQLWFELAQWEVLLMPSLLWQNIDNLPHNAHNSNYKCFQFRTTKTPN